MSTTVDLGKITASVTVGTTTTGAAGTNASVSNSGTTQDAVLNFTIPRGEQGVQGQQGSTGPQGPAGPTGPQGPMGDVAVITPEQQAAFTMYSTTGQNTNGPMTQAATTNAVCDVGDKIVSIQDSNTILVKNANSYYDKTSLNLVAGKRYRVKSYINVDHASAIRIYLRDNANSTTVLFNLGVNIPEHEFMSAETIYTCTDDTAQYFSIWTDTKINAQIKIRFELLELCEAASEDELENNIYQEVPMKFQNGLYNTDGSISSSTTRIVTPIIKVDGDFYVTIDNNYHYSLIYLNNNFTFDKFSNIGFWLNDKWKDSYNGFICVTIRSKTNGTISPSASTDFHFFKTKSTVTDIFPLELGAINGGVNVDSTSGCRIPSNNAIPIIKGETIFITFSLAQAGGNYGGSYLYMNGNYIDGTQYAINNGTHISITSDGTFNEIRFRILGNSTWTEQLASNSKVFVTRMLNVQIAKNSLNVISLQNKQVEQDDILNSIIAQTYKYNATIAESNPLQIPGILTLLHFSDIHGDVFAVEKALEFKSRYSEYIHDVIHSGDSVMTYYNDPNPFKNVVNGGSIINLIGNHDAWESGTYDYEMTEQEVYNYLLADDIASWGVTYQSGLTYYYKDYSVSQTRVIFVDSIHWHGYVAQGNVHDSERLANAANEDATSQKTWFNQTLSTTPPGYAVVCVTHYQPEKGINFLKNTGFCAYRPESSGIVTDGWFARDEIFGCVDTFINNGGKFMCWIMGHCHQDLVGTLVDHPNQFMVAIDRGGVHSHSLWDKHIYGTPSAYVFNVITFDSVNNLVKVTRIGNSYDAFMQSKKTLCYDISNKNMIYHT